MPRRSDPAPAGPARPALLWALALLAAAAGCTPAPPGEAFNDPFEARNREIHAFNKALDQAVLRPLARAALEAPPELTQPVVNVSAHAGLPGTVVNNLLQGDLEGAATNTLRFAINTTLGLAGLFDPAGEIGLREVETDFGATLAAWGVPEGAYLELPGIGPSTERDAAGRVVDFLVDPLDRLVQLPLALRVAAKAGEEVVERAQLFGVIDDILYQSADSYAQARLIYLQNRRFELGDTRDEAEVFFDPYEEEF
ncbi:VacJ family lipoprotein [Rubellimicrobium sp. CFH 75288]|uniref:MlaA family lipoprotein n=1 Tax=Rubellimicrobium sp. CFH 75288 TaxID=2697034 RepID=UPI001411FDEF|nr:VacJ family lipoprotein [Rubellimicrobium sp. CFH 75288]NAZ37673.1 VacJ family lipoprotein [Rubellimicrobium sp. CFH 75288]